MTLPSQRTLPAHALCAAAVLSIAFVMTASAEIISRVDMFTHNSTNPITMSFVHVGDKGNVSDQLYAHTNNPDNLQFGAVSYNYWIGEFALSIAQWRAFYSDTESGKTGSFATNYNYWGADQAPATNISWNNVAQYCNWLTTGKADEGVYEIVNGEVAGINRGFRNDAGIAYVIPTENEWYKAAYYKAGSTDAGYWLYATQQASGDPPLVLGWDGEVGSWIGSGSWTGADGTMNNDEGAVYLRSASRWPGDRENFPNHPEAIDESGGRSVYGTMGQAGNVWEWTEGLIASDRVRRGGAFNAPEGNLPASYRYGNVPTFIYNSVGFRVASIPEPGCTIMLLAGTVALLFWRQRRKA